MPRPVVSRGMRRNGRAEMAAPSCKPRHAPRHAPTYCAKTCAKTCANLGEPRWLRRVVSQDTRGHNAPRHAPTYCAKTCADIMRQVKSQDMRKEVFVILKYFLELFLLFVFILKKLLKRTYFFFKPLFFYFDFWTFIFVHF